MPSVSNILFFFKKKITYFNLLKKTAISGSIYEDYPSFHPRVCKTIKDLIPDHMAVKLSVGVVKHSRIVGAAIVAMMAEKIAATATQL